MILCKRTGNTSNSVDVLHDILSTRLQIGQKGDPVRNTLEIVNGQVDPDRSSDGEEMKDGVGRSSQDHGEYHGVLKRLSGHDIPGFEVELQEVSHGGSYRVTLGELVGVFGGEGGGSGEGHSEGFGGGGHGVGSVHLRGQDEVG